MPRRPSELGSYRGDHLMPVAPWQWYAVPVELATYIDIASASELGAAASAFAMIRSAPAGADRMRRAQEHAYQSGYDSGGSCLFKKIENVEIAARRGSRPFATSSARPYKEPQAEP